MSYNMYDKNYGSGFTPDNDNRPASERAETDTNAQQPVNGEYRFSYGFQPADDIPPVTPPPTGAYQPTGSHEPPKAPKRKKSSGGKGKIVALILAAVLLCGLAGAGGSYLVINALGSSEDQTADADNTVPEEAGGETEAGTGETPSSEIQVSSREAEVSTVPVEAGEAMEPSQIYDGYSGSVVSIEVQTAGGIGAGTGFVITEDGYILTCYHVVDGYQAISCTFIDSTSYEVEYVGGDEDADLAVLKIQSDTNTAFKPMVIGNSDLLNVGSTVTTIGNALGTFANTLTSGHVSGLDRALTMSDGTVMNVLQTDCTVNSGNSGGPLFNEYGEVIGVVNAKYSSSGYSGTAAIEGIGFAIPINDAMDILDDLMTHGYITGKPYLGISVSTVSSITAQQYSNMVVGAYVRSVEEGSCSEKAGLQVGDIITQVGGKDITTYEELIDAKNELRAGDEMTVTVYRENTYITLVITLDEEVPAGAADTTTEEDQQQAQDGNGYYYYYGDGSDGYGNYFDPYSFFGRGW